MKPIKLLERIDCKYKSGYSVDIKSIKPYLDKDCVIAFHEGKIGVIFVIKTSKKYFAFVGISEGLISYRLVFERVKLENAIAKLKDDCEILDNEEYSKVKRSVLVDRISNF